MSGFEVNFDGLVGPTHNYAGLSFGNVASAAHEGLVSSPRKAALQGLDKMSAMAKLGLKQAVLPSHERPHVPTLRKLGFHGASDAETVAKAARVAPDILASVCSASSMWVANAATISPYADCEDGRTHITPANLGQMFHRSIEVDITSKLLARIFDGDDFCHHPALPAGQRYQDEGAANHTRFCSGYGEPGVELFVYGVSGYAPEKGPKKYPARQTLESVEAIARSHGLSEGRTVFAQQNPVAIDAGVFHNDVIAVGNRQILFYHQLAFAETSNTLDALQRALGDTELHGIEVASDAVSLQDAVNSYLFNSQLVSVPSQDPDGGERNCIVAPSECEENDSVRRYLTGLVADNPQIDKVEFFDLRESMNNGGGPACLRLRVVMYQAQIDNSSARVFLDAQLESELRAWVERNYRDRLAASDFGDPELLRETRTALDELTQILRLGSLYEFQL